MRVSKKEIDRLIELYFSTLKILAQRPTHISALAAALLITKTFIVKKKKNMTERDRRERERETETERDRETEREHKLERFHAQW